MKTRNRFIICHPNRFSFLLYLIYLEKLSLWHGQSLIIFKVYLLMLARLHFPVPSTAQAQSSTLLWYYSFSKHNPDDVTLLHKILPSNSGKYDLGCNIPLQEVKVFEHKYMNMKRAVKENTIFRNPYGIT